MGYQYYLRTMGSRDVVELSAREHQEALAAKKISGFGLYLESKMDLVLENYAELERDLLDISLQYSLFSGMTQELLTGSTHLTNRRLANLLTTARLYLDQVPHDISGLFGAKSQQLAEFKQLAANEYDAHLGYRVMEALRNHVQHRGLPTHAMKLSQHMDGEGDNFLVRHQITPALSVGVLADDPTFKAPLLEELRCLADKEGRANLMPFVRQYVESLGRIHTSLRARVSSELEWADGVIQAYLDLSRLRLGGSWGVGVYAVDECLGEADREAIFPDLSERRTALERKNGRLEMLSKNYVSSKCDPV